MVAGRKTGSDNRKSLETGNALAPRVLRSAVILGPNGSGKSNLLRAMQFLSSFVEESFANAKPKEKIEVSPYRLDPEKARQNTELEIIFITDKNLYQFGFEYNSNLIVKEWLFMKPNAPGTRMRSVYEREYIEESNSYSWSLNESILKGERETWKESTRPNALFLSTAVQLNAKPLQAPYDWITNSFRVTNAPHLSNEFTSMLCKDKSSREHVIRFLNSVDVDISDVSIKERKLSLDNPVMENFSESFKATIIEQMKDYKTYDQVFFRTDKKGNSVKFRPRDESTGTMAIFSLAGPWIDVLENGLVLVIDELQNSLHPLALRHMASMFENQNINKSGAQLIFTTHDSSVLMGNFVHRDQVWLADRPTGDPSTLYPLSDFDIRDGEALQRGYLGGRYGALPQVKEDVLCGQPDFQQEESDAEISRTTEGD